ncbi:hypothetical protein [[Clostridium] hylemonae]|uniref:hypothetical protein n=1 Tax=[Clostridium] hylemonae TaxID=89153 RepID=UPI001FCC1B8B|nr:hypothetical protein [[Clostridium] hylemonae]BDF05022.1 hypothetical protein CE91St63_20840 [[Clostridium] hylemonae]
MSKWGKRLLGLAAIGSAVAGLVYYFKKKNMCDEEDEFEDDFEDEDFDLDNDLKSAADREYVPLTPSGKAEEDTGADTASDSAPEDK